LSEQGTFLHQRCYVDERKEQRIEAFL